MLFVVPCIDKDFVRAKIYRCIYEKISYFYEIFLNQRSSVDFQGDGGASE